MPIFMDRHYTKDATRLAIALAHERDLEIQDDYGVRFLTYWFDEERHTTFCLVDAPDEATVQKVHSHAHGDLPHEVIPVDPATVELFLGRIADPHVGDGEEGEAEVDSAFRVIMFTDLKDSTAMTSRLGEDQAMHLLRIHNAVARNSIRAHGGTEVKHTGDGFMVSFTTAVEALRCAVAMQQGFADHREAHAGNPLHVRIGIGCGEPVEEENDLFGTAVQTAARLCTLAEPDAVLVADEVVAVCEDRTGFAFGPSEPYSLKGIAEPVLAVELRPSMAQVQR